MRTYYTQFKGIWDEFSNYRPIPNCSCGKCTCGSMQSVSELHSQMYIYHFLMGLNDQFSIVRGQILLMEHLPPFNKVFSMSLQDERQREVSSTENCFTDSVAFMSSRPPTPFVPISKSLAPTGSFHRGGFRTNSNGRKDKPTCSHYGITGHTIDKCYKIHGFPPGFKFTRTKPPFNSTSSANQVQSIENQPPFPFSQAQCQQLMEFIQQNNLANSNTPSIHQVGSITNDDHLFVKASGNSSVSSFLDPNHYVLSSCHASMLSRVFEFSQTQTWIINTWVTDHMISSISMYTTITAMVSSHGKLPNG